MILHKRIPVFIDGVEHFVEVEEYSRGGSKSPVLFVVLHQGKRYVPRAQRLWGIDFTLRTHFTLLYSGIDLKDLVSGWNPFLDFLPRKETGA